MALQPKEIHACGIIKDKLEPIDYRTHKSNVNVSIEREFIIDFEGYGIILIKPSVQDFYKYEIGNKICYEISDKVDKERGSPSRTMWELLLILGGISAVVAAIIIVSLIWHHFFGKHLDD